MLFFFAGGCASLIFLCSNRFGLKVVVLCCLSHVSLVYLLRVFSLSCSCSVFCVSSYLSLHLGSLMVPSSVVKVIMRRGDVNFGQVLVQVRGSLCSRGVLKLFCWVQSSFGLVMSWMFLFEVSISLSCCFCPAVLEVYDDGHVMPCCCGD